MTQSGLNVVGVAMTDDDWQRLDENFDTHRLVEAMAEQGTSSA
jgi:hypothetical protein